MKEFIFENVLNSNITITINVNYFEEAMDILEREVFCAEDYKLK